MLLSHRIKLFHLFVLLSSSYTIPGLVVKQGGTLVVADDKASDHTQTGVDYAKETARIQVHLLGTTRSKIGEIIALLNNGHLKTIKNNKKIVAYFTSLTEELRHAQSVPLDGDNLELLARNLLILNEAILDYVTQMVSKNFRSFKAIPLKKLITQYVEKRTPDIVEEPLEEIQKKAIAMHQTLTQKIASVGLTLFNIAYRKFDDLFIDPIITYDLVPYGLGLASLTAAGLVAYWKHANDSFKQSGYVPQTVKDALGNAPKTPMPLKHPQTGVPLLDRDGLPRFTDAPMTSLGKVADYLTNGQNLMFASIATGYHKDWFMKEWETTIKPAIANKVQVMRNRLKGGIHLSIADKMDNKTINPVLFKDLIGIDYVVEEFKKIVEYMKDPELYCQLGLKPEKGYLLIGPPRTGKTMSVHALANELKLVAPHTRIIIVSPSTLWREGGIKGLFESARKQAPCILFMDEIDLLHLQRSTNSHVLFELLTAMSGLAENQDPRHQVIVIAATNRPETIDFALRQPGRFGRDIRFQLPCLEIRERTIIRRLQKLACTQFANAEEVVHRIALATAGASFEALNQLVDDAFTQARVSHEPLGEKHLEYALNTGYRNITMHLHEQIAESEMMRMAVHFAGQALAVHLLDSMAKLSLATIFPVKTVLREEAYYHIPKGTKEAGSDQDRYQYGSIFTYKEQDSVNILAGAELAAECKMHVAGIAAEEVVFGSATHTCNSGAMGHALKTARSIGFEGISALNLSKDEQNRRERVATDYVAQCKKEIHSLLTQPQNKAKLMTLAKALYEHKILNREAMLAIIGGAESSSPVDNPITTATTTTTDGAKTADTTQTTSRTATYRRMRHHQPASPIAAVPISAAA